MRDVQTPGNKRQTRWLENTLKPNANQTKIPSNRSIRDPSGDTAPWNSCVAQIELPSECNAKSKNPRDGRYTFVGDDQNNHSSHRHGHAHGKKPKLLHPERYGTARTKEQFEAERKETISDALLEHIGKIENGYNPDDPEKAVTLTEADWRKKGDNGTLGLYQFTNKTLIDIGAKSQSGWNTPFDHAYNINSELDFRKNHAAQNAAMGQLVRRYEKNIDDLYGQYGDSVYLDDEARSITVTRSGLIAALQKQGIRSVKNYFDVYGDDVKNGKAVAPDFQNHAPFNVQTRMRWTQTFD